MDCSIELPLQVNILNVLHFCNYYIYTPVLGDYDNHDCSIQVKDASVRDQGLWTCEMEYYKFGGGRGSSKILKRDTYVHIIKPTTSTTTTPKSTSLIIATVAQTKTRIVHTPDVVLPVGVAKIVPVSISILVVVIFVVLFTLIVVLHKLKNVRNVQQFQTQRSIEAARTRLEAELSKIPDINDVKFLRSVFPHVMKLPSDDLGLNL